MKGIRVIDMTQALSGPFCTWLLGSLGADVIKVEPPGGEPARNTPPYKDGVSLYFESVNRNKRSIVLDLKTPAGVDALHKLIATADVLVENMRPGVRARLGCSDEELERINPTLVLASISGFGQTGPLASQPAYDIVVQAMSGMMSINGPLGGPATRVGFSIGDIAASLFATIGILQRLYERDAAGAARTSHLDVSMLGCQWACLENAFARFLNAGIVPGPIGSRHPSMTPFETYPGSDRDFVIALGGQQDWHRFLSCIGLPELGDDPRFESEESRLEHREALWSKLAEHFEREPAQVWIDRMLEQSIPCSVIEDVQSIAASELSDAYQAFSAVRSPDGRERRFVRNPIAEAGVEETPAPALGEHTEELLREIGAKI